MDFVGICPMFLTTPTIKELQELELSKLIDLLAIQTSNFTQIKEGLPSQINDLKEYILRIQTAIEIKRTLKEQPVQTPQSPAQDLI